MNFVYNIDYVQMVVNTHTHTHTHTHTFIRARENGGAESLQLIGGAIYQLISRLILAVSAADFAGSEVDG
jgi:hypothetical protein